MEAMLQPCAALACAQLTVVELGVVICNAAREREACSYH
jgi:hypothetical protein